MFRKLDWIVVPGGPGLSAKYLKWGLSEPFKEYKLHFYNPLGAPDADEDRIPKVNELVEQIFEVAKQKELKSFGLITHSFGNYLAMRALQKKQNKISSIIMISPMPFVYSKWKNGLAQIAKSIPKNVLEKIQQLAKKQNNGAEIFKVFFPYYASKTAALPDIPFSLKTCDAISAQVDEYDDTELLKSCKLPWVCIIGDKDPLFVEKKLLQNDTIVVFGTGHYPFFEDPKKFNDAVKKVEEKLCQKQITVTQNSF
ncbi:MAG: alpha/beta hydrolase [Gammaproteobacteria bacterium]|jgi:pimeloyl-ACP methyl ester carboxylesterase